MGGSVEGELPADLGQAAQLGLGETAGRLEPTEWLFDEFADDLAQAIGRAPVGAPVERGMLGRGRRLRGTFMERNSFDEILRVATLAGADPDAVQCRVDSDPEERLHRNVDKLLRFEPRIGADRDQIVRDAVEGAQEQLCPQRQFRFAPGAI